MRTVGAYEAKTHLSRLLEQVARGEVITITKHGVPVAMLVSPTGKHQADPGWVIEELRKFRKGITLGGLSLGEMIKQGRR